MELFLRVMLSSANRGSRMWGRISFTYRLFAILGLEVALSYPAMKLLFGQ